VAQRTSPPASSVPLSQSRALVNSPAASAIPVVTGTTFIFVGDPY
jgi:hypothetical protein